MKRNVKNIIVIIFACIIFIPLAIPVMAEEKVTAGTLNKPAKVTTGSYVVTVPNDSATMMLEGRLLRFVAPQKGTYVFAISNLRSEDYRGLNTIISFGNLQQVDDPYSGDKKMRFVSDYTKKCIPGGSKDVQNEHGRYSADADIGSKDLRETYINYCVDKLGYTKEKAEKENNFTNYVTTTKYSVYLKKGEAREVHFSFLKDVENRYINRCYDSPDRKSVV